MRLVAQLSLSAGLVLALPAARAEVFYLIVSGIGGNAEYEESFSASSDSLADAARRTVTDSAHVSVLKGPEATREALQAQLEELAAEAAEADSVAVMLIGHGSYDGDQYKFNLAGPDMTGTEIGSLLAAIPARTQLVVNATSASGAVLEDWTAEGRTLITATRSGAERNATRFGTYWAEALSSDTADINKDAIVTAQEAFDFASRQVEDSFESDGALATEHPQLVGDAAARFNAARLVARVADTPELRSLNEELDAIERRIEEHRLRREQMDPDEYLSQLQELLVELALVQRQIDDAGGGADSE